MNTSRNVVIEWGIRSSFVSYVEALPDGRVQVGDGAQRSEDHAFLFPGILQPTGDIHCTGFVRFGGHRGMLSVMFEDFRIHRNQEVCAHVNGADCCIATLSNGREGPGERLVFEKVTLTDDGAFVLGDIYRPGDPLRPLTIVPRGHPAEFGTERLSKGIYAVP